MFNGLFSSIFGKSKENNNLKSDESENNNHQLTDANSTKKSVFNEENVRVILLEDDKDWLFVEREENEDDDVTVSADKKATNNNNLQLVPFKSILSHLSAVKENDENCLLSANLPLSLYPNTMDESWFLTPPSCFSSASIQLEASPLENLLIEHPSMSVYRRRRSLAEVNSDELEDLVVLELSQDVDNTYAVTKAKRGRAKNAKKPRTNGPNQRSSVALVLVSKPSTSTAVVGAQEKTLAMTRSFFDRNNKTLRNSYKKNLHTINQPSSRTMSRKN